MKTQAKSLRSRPGRKLVSDYKRCARAPTVILSVYVFTYTGKVACLEDGLDHGLDPTGTSAIGPGVVPCERK